MLLGYWCLHDDYQWDKQKHRRWNGVGGGVLLMVMHQARLTHTTSENTDQIETGSENGYKVKSLDYEQEERHYRRELPVS